VFAAVSNGDAQNTTPSKDVIDLTVSGYLVDLP
jgi:hypothetical protein